MMWWLFVVFAFLFVAWLFYMAFTTKGSSNFVKKETDLEILEGRRARGEIDETEYRQRKADMVGGRKKSSSH